MACGLPGLVSWECGLDSPFLLLCLAAQTSDICIRPAQMTRGRLVSFASTQPRAVTLASTMTSPAPQDGAFDAHGASHYRHTCPRVACRVLWLSSLDDSAIQVPSSSLISLPLSLSRRRTLNRGEAAGAGARLASSSHLQRSSGRGGACLGEAHPKTHGPDAVALGLE